MKATHINSMHTGVSPRTGQNRDANSQTYQHNHDAQRDTGKSLAGEIASNVARNALISGEEAAKATAKATLSTILFTTMGPINAFVHHTPGAMLILKPLSSWFARKIENYAEKFQIKLPANPHKMAECLLEGHFGELSTDITDFLAGFVEKSLSPELQKAFTNGDLIGIGKLTGTQMADGVMGLLDNIKKTEGNFFTKPFKWLGMVTPGVNKLPKTFQPWAAGLGFMMFGGIVIKGAMKLIKWVAFGAGGIALWNFAKKALMGKVQSSTGLGSMLGASHGASAHKPGIMDALKLGSNLLGGFSKAR